MRHPFELKISELEAVNLNTEEELTDKEAAQVAGGLVTTQALGEEGGCTLPPIKSPITTLALGEEGGLF